ncbi:MAG: insulinase family protein [Oscillospiraceae bacterium]|nr:insulinase family protein [Oscillospiraceae bacterium]
MHTAYSSQISPGVALRCVKTDKFKTGCLTINLITGLNYETAALSALLPRVLRRGSTSLPSMERIAEALDDLYGARVEPIVRKKGELQCIGFYADFPDDRFIPVGDSVLPDVAALIGDMLLSPDLSGGLLRTDYVESERKNLIDDIRAGINDKRGYSVDRLLEEMCAGEAFGVSRLGSETEAEKITPETLTAHYRHILDTARVEVFYCGPAEPEFVETALTPVLRRLPPRGDAPVPKTEVILKPAPDSPRRFTEVLDVQQGKLTLGFRLGNAMEHPDYPALMVLNAIYGGNVTSKLFLNVREKLSLCYYASSMLEKHKGIMIVASGVEFSKFDEALNEILAQLQNVKDGDISDWELTSAKRAITTAIKSAMDRPAGLEDLYFDSAIAAVAYSPDQLFAGVEAVTRDKIVEMAAGIETDSIYFLTGKEVQHGA